MGIEMKIIFLQNLTGGLFGGILKGLLKNRLNGLFARTPTIAVLLLTAVIAACASSSKSNDSSTADCTFAEDVGTKDCGSITLPQIFDSPTTYNVTVGEVGEETTNNIRFSNFIFTQIINGSVSGRGALTSDRLILAANVDTLNITISGIAPNVFGNFYIELDLFSVNNIAAAVAVKVRYTISITSVNDAPVFVRGNSPGVQFDSANDARNASYGFAGIPFNSTAGYSVGNVSVTDIDNDTITYRIIGGADDIALFQINPTTGESAKGEITLKAIADADSVGDYTFNVTANDGKKDGITIAVINVRVLPDNQPPMFEAGNNPEVRFTLADGATPATYTFAGIPFNSIADYLVGNVSARDDDGDTVTYNISGGTDDDALFTINSTTGVITLGAVATNDGNLSISYTFNVIASDSKGGSTMAVINVRVLPNQPPMFIAVSGLESQFIAENDTGRPLYNFDGVPINSAMGYSVGNVLATNPDGNTPTYSISIDYLINEDINTRVENALFTIDSATGEVTLIATAVAANSGMYQVNVTATDDQGVNATATISVYVDNSIPVFDGRAPYEFDLSLSAAVDGVVIGNVSATDEQRTLFDYSLAKDGNLFEDLFEPATADNADGTRNIILSRDANLSDFAVPSITFQVVARHQSGGLVSNADVTVNLINDLELDSDFDEDGVQGFYDAFLHDATMNVTGNGEPGTPYIISNIYQLQAIAGVDHEGTPLSLSDFTGNSFLYGTDAADQLTKHYKLANDINASATADTAIWAKPEVEGYIGRGWTPIAGNSGQSFSGSFSGEGYAINSLEILARQGDNSKHFGLFGINNGNITAVGLQNINMVIQAVGNNYLGTTTVDTIVDGSHAGGLVALNQEDGNITYSYTTGLANGSMDAMGGLVGLNQGKISYSYSTATVQGAGDTGGLVGTNEGGSLLSSYATGSVNGSTGIFGRVGTAGGLAGSISGAGAIISTSYAAGNVSDKEGDTGASLGGVVAESIGSDSGVTIESSYWDRDTTGVARGVGGNRSTNGHGDETGTTGLTTAKLQGCKLDGAFIPEGTDPTCTFNTVVLFPTSNWGVDTTDGVTRSWMFNAGKYPSLSAVRSSDSKDLLPSAADQECHRNSMSSGC